MGDGEFYPHAKKANIINLGNIPTGKMCLIPGKTLIIRDLRYKK